MTDLINSPPHYKDGGIETIDFIEAKNLNYRLGNVIKYVSRAGKKDNVIQDLEKAKWYLDREISKLKEKNNEENEWGAFARIIEAKLKEKNNAT